MGPMIHSACVESWDAETGEGEERRTTEQRREFLLTAMPEQLQVRSSVGWKSARRGLRKVNTFNLKTHLTAPSGPGCDQPPGASTVKGSRLQCGAPIDGGGG